MRFLLLLFIVMPIVEMWLLITVGSSIGAIYTILLVLLTALMGIALLKRQGFATLWRGREKLQEGRVPAQEMGEAMVLAVSGALLLTPGFITDAIGFAGLVPVLRQALVNRILRRINISSHAEYGRASGASHSASGDIIDGESWDSADSLKKPK
jgi:UPF0716 protein FxsA